MSKKCAVCEEGKGPEICEVCGFTDGGVINDAERFINKEDAEYWFETVVKPYRVRWEAERLTQIKKLKLEAKQREAGSTELSGKPLVSGSFSDLVIAAARNGLSEQEISRRYQLSVDQVRLILRYKEVNRLKQAHNSRGKRKNLLIGAAIGVVVIIIGAIILHFAMQPSTAVFDLARPGEKEIDAYLLAHPDLPEVDQSCIADGRFEIGMLAETVRLLLGEPEVVEYVKQPWAQQMHWKYRKGKMYMFIIEDKHVVGIDVFDSK